MKYEIACDGHGGIAAADGQWQFVVFGITAHLQHAFDNAVTKGFLCFDRNGHGRGAIGIDGLFEVGCSVCLEFGRKDDGEGAVATRQVMVEKRECVEEFIVRRDGAWAGRHDADGVANDEGCIAGTDSFRGGTNRHKPHGTKMFWNMDNRFNRPVFRQHDRIQNNDGWFFGCDWRDDAGDAATADFSIIGNADVREKAVVAVDEIRLEITLSMEEVENVRSMVIRQGENAFIDGEKMDNAGGRFAVFICDLRFDFYISFRANHIRDV